MPQFVHLHLHTHYSLLDGLIKPKELVKKIKEDGQEAVAITDHGVMYGAIDFYEACKAEGIKPIIGMEAYVAPNGRHNKRAKSDEKQYHLTLLAKDNIGYKNLIQLASLAQLEGFYYKPRIDDELLERYHEGIIALSGCLHGEIPTLILSGREDAAREKIRYYGQLFGNDNFYLEIQYQPSSRGQVYVNDALKRIAKEMDMPLVATNDSHYLNKDDDEAQDVLICLQIKRKKKEMSRMTLIGNDLSVKTAQQMAQDFADVPEAISNTVKIAAMCNVEITLGQYQLPFFAVPEGYTEQEYLGKLCRDGVMKRYGKPYEEATPEQRERLQYELSVIEKMGFPSYFLIVADFVNWAKDQNIQVGPGRGSAAGSYVSYLLGITNMDPIKYDLLFERFLNPERISMPDIDLDFADIRREEVIKYVEGKYGQDHVAQIITFATMAARAAVRDVGRVLDYPYDYCDKISKAIPMFHSIEKALGTPELKELYEQEAGVREIIDNARKIENVSRHASVHACGVLITKNPVTDYAPVQYASSSEQDSLVSQYSLHPVEALGLLKMDFLGLKNLTIIESALRIIRKTKGVEIGMDTLPMDDKNTYRLLQEGGTTGVFQLESAGMKRYLKELKPTEFEDIIAMVALYRPGPMEWIPDYIAGKHGVRTPTYLHPTLKPILQKTYGVAIYQEQVMQIARDLAGFTMGEADVLRKAMGKKIVKLLGEQKEKFITGCIKNGVDGELARQVFSFIEPFAGYGFNRSHAACYALVGYQTAYLKANYPTEFMAALMTADQEHTDRIPVLIEECRQMGIAVLPPDVNESFTDFAVVPAADPAKETIRFGLRAIKNVGAHIAEVIIAERKRNGQYKDIADFLNRVQDKDLNKKSMESLIMVGAFDALGERGQLLANLDAMLAYNRAVANARDRGQDSLFSMAPELQLESTIHLAAAEPADKGMILTWEKELLGFYVSGHPFNDFERVLQGKVRPIGSIKATEENKFVVVAGIVGEVKKIVTKSNETMAFVKIEDKQGAVEFLVFPRTLKDTPNLWEPGTVVIASARVSNKDNELKLIVSEVKRLHLVTAEQTATSFLKKHGAKKPWRERPAGGWSNNGGGSKAKEIPALPLKIKLDNFEDVELLGQVKHCLAQSQGESKVYFYVPNGGEKLQVIETAFRVKNDDVLKGKLMQLLGHQAVK